MRIDREVGKVENVAKAILGKRSQNNNRSQRYQQRADTFWNISGVNGATDLWVVFFLSADSTTTIECKN